MERRLACPRCESPLQQLALGDAPVHRCGGCEAFFAPAALVEPDAEVAEEGWAPGATCPRCARALVSGWLAGLRVEACGGCGGVLVSDAELLVTGPRAGVAAGLRALLAGLQGQDVA